MHAATVAHTRGTQARWMNNTLLLGVFMLTIYLTNNARHQLSYNMRRLVMGAVLLFSCTMFVALLHRLENPTHQQRHSLLLHKQTIAVVVCLTAKNTKQMPLAEMAIAQLLVPSFGRTVEVSTYEYVLYVGVDDDDPVWTLPQSVSFLSSIGTAAGAERVVIKRFRNRANHIPMNEILKVAYDDGCHYFVRVNDDTEFVTAGWTTLGIKALAAFDPPNVGVVGPTCHEGNAAILTHDMTHRTHLDIFDGVYYADEFDNWWLDDWISRVYGPTRTHKLASWTVKHHVGFHGTRYEVQHHKQKLLAGELATGGEKVRRWLIKKEPVNKHVCLQTPTVPYGETSNQVLQLANALAIGTVLLDDAAYKWFEEWFEPHERVAFNYGTPCSIVFRTYADYKQLHDMHDYHTAHPALQTLQLRKDHCRRALELYSVPFVSVHRRHLEGQCVRRISNKETFCANRGWNDASPCSWHGKQFDKEVVLFTDKQQPNMDRTFENIGKASFAVEMCAMTLSSEHYGNPASSVDYLVSQWRNNHGMNPTGCWARPPDFTITILTMNRVASLRRLLTSLENATYGTDTIALVIKVDHSSDNKRVISLAKSFIFSHGNVKVHIENANQGLRQSWINAWYPATDKALGIILEDDVEVCSEWYTWLRGAWKAYEGRDDMAGISLQRQTHKMLKPHSSTFEILNDHKPFLYKLVGTIGFSPQPRVWRQWVDWVQRVDLAKMDYAGIGQLAQLETTTWFETLDRRGFWEHEFIYKCERESLYTLYLLLPHSKALATHWQEKGEHFAGGGKDFELAVTVPREFPTHLNKYGWDGQRDLMQEQIDAWPEAVELQSNTIVATMSTDKSELISNFVHYAPRAVVFSPQGVTMPASVRFAFPSSIVPDKNAQWGQKTFWDINAVKPTLILKILQMGYNVTWADRDVVFLKRPVFQGNECDIFASLDAGVMCSESRDYSCAGFLHFRNTARTVKFVSEWESRSRLDTKENDQCHFQRLVTKTALAKVCHLKPNEYVNGHMWVPTACRSTCLTAKELRAATMLHSNYLIGDDAKIAALKKAGYWYTG